MRTCLVSLLGLTLLLAPAHGEEPGYDLAFMPRTMPVTLLNEGGKYVAIDLKHIPQGGTCRMEKDAIVMRVGSSTNAGATLVRYIAPQTSSGGCPFLTTFELSEADYTAGRSAFLAAKTDAWQRVDELKKQLGDKWDELMGKKSDKSGVIPGKQRKAPAKMLAAM
jgi:hypothetical protein